MDLVELKKNEIVCDSSMVTRKFGVKHNEVIKRIEGLFKDYPDLSAGSTGTKSLDFRGVSNTPKTCVGEISTARFNLLNPQL